MQGDMETSDLRRRLRQALDQAKKDSAERRTRADEAATAYRAFLRDIGVPVFKMFANVARGEGHAFTVFTPADGVQMTSDRHKDDFVELWLDTSLDPPRVATRVNHSRGRNVTTKEGLLRPAAPINSLDDEDVVEFLLAEFGSLVEK